MTESSKPRGRPQRIYKNRESRLAYHQENVSRYFSYSSASPSSAAEHDPNAPLTKFPEHAHPQSLVTSSADPAYLDLLSFPPASSSSHAPGLVQTQDQKGHYQNASYLAPYTFPSTLPPTSSLPSADSTLVAPLAPGSFQAGASGNYQFAPRASADVFPSDGEDVAMSDPGSRVSSVDGLHSLHSFNSGEASYGTQRSSMTEGYVWPVTGPTFSQATITEAVGDLRLSLTAGYLQPGLLDPSYSPETGSPPLAGVIYDNDIMPNWNNPDNLYAPEHGQWDPRNFTPEQPMRTNNSQSPPWSPVRQSDANNRVNAGDIIWEPRGSPYDTFQPGEGLISPGQQIPMMPRLDPVSPASESWEYVPSYDGSITMNSPNSEAHSWYRVDSSPQDSPSPHQMTGQSHTFRVAAPEPPSPKPPRGRQRALTTQEKQEASDVRKAKACWACHLSKIKCSPCSQNTPCQQCERLHGKRRFCLLRCFNDPLESLQKFVIPEYLTGHFTQARVEEVVAKNTTRCDTYQMRIRLSWGYRKPMEAVVVALEMPRQSRLAYNDHTDGSANKNPIYVRKKSPPLGIALPSFGNMKKDYGRMVSAIVMEDLQNYVPVPYCDDESGLPERLLQIICSFYTAGLNADQECTLLREVLEIHVISTILERNLNLDAASKRTVEGHLKEEYAERCAPKCAQQQIKYALFMAQQERVISVLKDWGAMMWSSNKSVDAGEKWAKSFSVLAILVLIVDKMVESAYLLHDGRVRNHGRDGSAELKQFEELVRLTQTHVFEQTKEIFHSSFKTRKGGKEACNPIRDGIETAFRGRQVPERIARLVHSLKRAHSDFGAEIRSQLRFGAGAGGGEYYENAGRLASVFLGDFLEPC